MTNHDESLDSVKQAIRGAGLRVTPARVAILQLLRRAELGGHVWRFEIVGSEAGRVAAHPHFLCIDCGEVTCLDDVELTDQSRLETDRVGEVTEILVRGHCNSCRVAC